MSSIQIIFLVLGIFIGLPIIAYMVVKFAAAGYFRAKRRDEEKHNHNHEKIEK